MYTWGSGEIEKDWREADLDARVDDGLANSLDPEEELYQPLVDSREARQDAENGLNFCFEIDEKCVDGDEESKYKGKVRPCHW